MFVNIFGGRDLKIFIKRYWYLFIIFLVCLIGIYLYNFIFPKAMPIELSQSENISKVQIMGYNKKFEYTNREIIDEIVDVFLNARPTRKLTLNDEPSEYDYFIISFISNESYRDSYIYKRGIKWYIEQPYHGIYEIKQDTLDFIEY